MVMQKTPFTDPMPPPVKKAGIVIHGRNAKGEHALVAPYSQGRFYDEAALVSFADWHGDIPDDRTKYYVLPKGSIDKGEDVFDAAIRETAEETGIDAMRLLGEEGVDRLRRGETLTDMPSPGYPGVHLYRADARPAFYRFGTKRQALFNIELEDLMPLEPFLKNYEQRDRSFSGEVKSHPKVVESVDYMLSRRSQSGHDEPPRFNDALHWLHHGAIPPDGFNIGPHQSPTRDPRHRTHYQMLLGSNEFVAHAPNPSLWFAQLEQHYAPQGHITSRGDWKQFREAIPPVERHTLDKAVARIKRYVRGRGVIGDDYGTIKLDDKDEALFYYMEGADIVSFERFVGHSLTLGLFNKQYGEKMLGSDRGHFSEGHLVSLMPFCRPRDIDRSCERFRREASEHLPMLKWASLIRPAKSLPANVDYKDIMHQARNEQLLALGSDWGGRLGARPEPSLGSFGR